MKKERFLVVTPGYPSTNNKYNNAFVHTRIKKYLEKKIDCVVFSISKNKQLNEYIYEDVIVKTGDHKCLEKYLKENDFSKVLIHFGWKKTIETILKVNKKMPLIIWVHGTEALGWYRRLFFFDIKKPYRFLGYIILNIRQMIFMHYLICNKDINKKFVFVSNWMKDILEVDSFSKNRIKNYEIIPNVIDEKMFNYVEKSSDMRLNIFSIRPYASKKYANDISVKVVKILSEKEWFNKLHFSFYGDGRLFDKTLEPLKEFKNVSINKKFLSQQEISSLHKENGIVLIPTRQDAQGVSMCEAMSSGLVPVTSNNTAIPEFVDNKSGYLCNNPTEMANAIEEMYYNIEIFKNKSKNAHLKINNLTKSDIVIKKELDYILKK